MAFFWLQCPLNLQVCVLITTSAQFWLGVVPPLLLSVRRETTAALEVRMNHSVVTPTVSLQ